MSGINIEVDTKDSEGDVEKNGDDFMMFYGGDVSSNTDSDESYSDTDSDESNSDTPTDMNKVDGGDKNDKKEEMVDSFLNFYGGVDESDNGKGAVEGVNDVSSNTDSDENNSDTDSDESNSDTPTDMNKVDGGDKNDEREEHVDNFLKFYGGDDMYDNGKGAVEDVSDVSSDTDSDESNSDTPADVPPGLGTSTGCLPTDMVSLGVNLYDGVDKSNNGKGDVKVVNDVSSDTDSDKSVNDTPTDMPPGLGTSADNFVNVYGGVDESNNGKGDVKFVKDVSSGTDSDKSVNDTPTDMPPGLGTSADNFVNVYGGVDESNNGKGDVKFVKDVSSGTDSDKSVNDTPTDMPPGLGTSADNFVNVYGGVDESNNGKGDVESVKDVSSDTDSDESVSDTPTDMNKVDGGDKNDEREEHVDNFLKFYGGIDMYDNGKGAVEDVSDVSSDTESDESVSDTPTDMDKVDGVAKEKDLGNVSTTIEDNEINKKKVGGDKKDEREEHVDNFVKFYGGASLWDNANIEKVKKQTIGGEKENVKEDSEDDLDKEWKELKKRFCAVPDSKESEERIPIDWEDTVNKKLKEIEMKFSNDRSLEKKKETIQRVEDFSSQNEMFNRLSRDIAHEFLHEYDFQKQPYSSRKEGLLEETVRATSPSYQREKEKRETSKVPRKIRRRRKKFSKREMLHLKELQKRLKFKLRSKAYGAGSVFGYDVKAEFEDAIRKNFDGRQREGMPVELFVHFVRKLVPMRVEDAQKIFEYIDFDCSQILTADEFIDFVNGSNRKKSPSISKSQSQPRFLPTKATVSANNLNNIVEQAKSRYDFSRMILDGLKAELEKQKMELERLAECADTANVEDVGKFSSSQLAILVQLRENRYQIRRLEEEMEKERNYEIRNRMVKLREETLENHLEPYYQYYYPPHQALIRVKRKPRTNLDRVLDRAELEMVCARTTFLL
eukprot:g3948.t1